MGFIKTTNGDVFSVFQYFYVKNSQPKCDLVDQLDSKCNTALLTQMTVQKFGSNCRIKNKLFYFFNLFWNDKKMKHKNESLPDSLDQIKQGDKIG